MYDISLDQLEHPVLTQINVGGTDPLSLAFFFRYSIILFGNERMPYLYDSTYMVRSL